MSKAKKTTDVPQVSRETLPQVSRETSKAIVDGWYNGNHNGLAIWIEAGSQEEAESILGGGSVEPASRFPTAGEDFLVRIDGKVWRLSVGGFDPRVK